MKNNFLGLLFLLTFAVFPCSTGALASNTGTATRSVEEILKAVINANADRDLAEMARLMSRDPNLVIYTINGRVYRGWQEMVADLEEEFRSVESLEIPIRDMTVSTQGDTAWFSMDIDYTRYLKNGRKRERMVLPLRETGVLVRRGGEWVIVMWHEYYRNLTARPAIDINDAANRTASNGTGAKRPDFSGTWHILEEDKSYTATLDGDGNGAYTHDGGTLRTTGIAAGIWQGTWSQTGETTGSSREGGFRLVLSADGSNAKGEWWYTRVGTRAIPPHRFGGSYQFTRISGASRRKE
ncbi:MAG: YybH family protein [Gammaproteobacteria bacterium]